MTDPTNPAEDFRSQVQRLVTEGKLTAEEAQGLLEGVDESSVGLRPIPVETHTLNVPPNLVLRVSGYGLTVIKDTTIAEPQLSASFPQELRLIPTADGWHVERTNQLEQRVNFSANPLKAILTVPFTPDHVNAEIHGGNLTLPDIAGQMKADVNGGNIRMGQAASMKADVNGGNLNATEMHGPTHLSVNGGNLTLTGAHSLNASVNGGNLKWAGVLASGDHRLEVNAGNASLQLLPGSSVRLDAQVTVGSFKADFPTEKHGSFVTTRHTGQLGGGSAFLSCKVAAGQVKVTTA